MAAGGAIWDAFKKVQDPGVQKRLVRETHVQICGRVHSASRLKLSWER